MGEARYHATGNLTVASSIAAGRLAASDNRLSNRNFVDCRRPLTPAGDYDPPRIACFAMPSTARIIAE
jgi:hypothetical protein